MAAWTGLRAWQRGSGKGAQLVTSEISVLNGGNWISPGRGHLYAMILIEQIQFARMVRRSSLPPCTKECPFFEFAVASSGNKTSGYKRSDTCLVYDPGRVDSVSSLFPRVRFEALSLVDCAFGQEDLRCRSSSLRSCQRTNTQDEGSPFLRLQHAALQLPFQLSPSPYPK
jgi:hypothetical protein